jgi:hypothetical protein
MARIVLPGSPGVVSETSAFRGNLLLALQSTRVSRHGAIRMQWRCFADNLPQASCYAGADRIARIEPSWLARPLEDLGLETGGGVQAMRIETQWTGAGARWTPPSSPGTGVLTQRSSIPIVLYEHYRDERRPPKNG